MDAVTVLTVATKAVTLLSKAPDLIEALERAHKALEQEGQADGQVPIQPLIEMLKVQALSSVQELQQELLRLEEDFRALHGLEHPLDEIDARYTSFIWHPLARRAFKDAESRLEGTYRRLYAIVDDVAALLSCAGPARGAIHVPARLPRTQLQMQRNAHRTCEHISICFFA